MPVSQEHWLKVENAYFDALFRDEKPFEVRRDDRGFQRGDVLVLCRYGSEHRAYLNESGKPVSDFAHNDKVQRVTRRISYVLTGGQYGIEPGYVVLGLERNDIS